MTTVCDHPPGRRCCLKWPLYDLRGQRTGWTWIEVGDIEIVSRYTWRVGSNGYVMRQERNGDRRIIRYLHRDLTGLGYGDPLTVDHRDRDKLNNRRSNLRAVTQAVNNQNHGLRSDNISGHAGVSYCRRTGRWLATIRRGGKTIYLGRHATPELAAIRLSAEKKVES